MFFTKIEKTLITDESPSDLQSLAKSSLLELGESSMFYTYESILKGCTRLLASNKPLPIRQFYDLNTNIATRKLLEEALNNFGSFLNSYLEEGGVVSLKDIKSVLSNAK